MRSCDRCDEPAVKVAIHQGADYEKQYLCYVHAVERGLTDFPMETVRAVAEAAGYSVHAVLFLTEALVRADGVESASDVWVAAIRSAKERFGESAGEALEHWQLLSRGSIGEVYLALQKTEVLQETAELTQGDFAAELTLADLLDAV